MGLVENGAHMCSMQIVQRGSSGAFDSTCVNLPLDPCLDFLFVPPRHAIAQLDALGEAIFRHTLVDCGFAHGRSSYHFVEANE
jgi:hypothetical protein